METIARSCKELQRLRVEDDETGAITQRGLVAVAQGCANLVQLIVFVASISNAALAMIGQGCPRLTDFRIVLEPTARPDYAPPDFPLDDGLKLLLKGCVHLTRLAFYQRHGCLTDRGMEHIGTYGHNLKWLLLGCTGQSDVGLANLAYRSQRIQRLEIRDCPFGEPGLAAAMSSLKYLWVHGLRAMDSVGKELVKLARPGLTIEICPPPPGQRGLQLFAYYSLVGPRSDGPPELKIFTSKSTPATALCPATSKG
jgi:coronatine-insensitive protein 1